MNRLWIGFGLSLFFVVLGFLILYDQYLLIEIWFQAGDLHHETFALSAFALAIGVLIGTLVQKK